jgi:hypothetical protein
VRSKRYRIVELGLDLIEKLWGEAVFIVAEVQ